MTEATNEIKYDDAIGWLERACLTDYPGIKLIHDLHEAMKESAADIAKYVEQLLRHKAELRRIAGVLLTVRVTNQTEWMEYAAEIVNDVAEELGEPERFRFDGDGLRKIQP